MRLLLDTHVVLWFLRGDSQLPVSIRELIQERGRKSYVSVASLWEIAIKVSRRKLTLPRAYDDLFPETLETGGLHLLEITVAHLSGVLRLEHHHRDPFDRLLVAQAKSEDLTLVTCDTKLSAYGARTFWV